MRVAVIGGTGFVGSYIVDALAEAGHTVSLLVRPGSRSKLQRDDVPVIVEGDVSDSNALGQLLSGCDAVIYCIGILREYPRDGVTFAALQYEGVVRTVEAAINNGVRRFLLMSANGVKTPGTPYQETKKRAEDVVLASGLDASVFRPSVIFGDPRGLMEIATQLYRQMVRPPVPAVGFFTGRSPEQGKILMSPVHVGDVADAFVRALEDPATFSKVFELGGPEELSWVEMIRRVSAAVGKQKWVLPYPIGLMKFAARLLDWLPFFPATRDQLVMLAEGNTADPAILVQLLGRAPRPFTPAELSYLGD